MERTILWDEYRIEVNPKNEKTHVFGLSYMEPYFPLNIDSPNPKAAIPSLFARLKDMVTTELIIVERQNGELDTFILKIVPDLQYPNSRFKKEDFGFLRVSEDFSGTYNWFDWNERPINGLRFKEGKISQQIEFKEFAQKQPDENNASLCYSLTTWNIWSVTTSSGTVYHSEPMVSLECQPIPETGGYDTSLNDGTLMIPPDYYGGGMWIDFFYNLKNELNNPCASGIFDNLTHINLDNITSLNGTNVNITQMVLNLFKQSDKFDYIVKEGVGLEDDESANTSFARINPTTGQYEITTSFNPNYLNTATQLSIARTMIHESIHAYLQYEQRANPYDDPYDAIRNYSFSTGITDPNILHHEFMPAYIEAMALSLHQWDKNYGGGGNHGWQYYKDLAWGGLTHHKIKGQSVLTEAFKANFPNFNERSRAINVIQNEAKNEPMAKGDPCI